MQKVDIILTAAVNLAGEVVRPSDEPVPVEAKLAAQLIANGRARLPAFPKSESDEAGDQDQKVAEAEKAALARIKPAEQKAKDAEANAKKRIEKSNERVGNAEIKAKEKIDAQQQAVKDAEVDAIAKMEDLETQVAEAAKQARDQIAAHEKSVDATKLAPEEPAPPQPSNKAKGT